MPKILKQDKEMIKDIAQEIVDEVTEQFFNAIDENMEGDYFDDEDSETLLREYAIKKLTSKFKKQI